MRNPTRISSLAFVGTVVLLVCWAVLATQPAAAWEDRPVNPNFDLVQEALPDVVIDDPDVDLQAYLEQLSGRAASDYAPPLIIPAAAFNGDSQTSDYFFSFGTGRFGAGDGCFMAPVYLPHGATVDNFFIFAYDNSTSDLTLTMWRKQTTTTAAPTVMAAVTTSGALSTIQTLGDTTVTDPVVNSNYTYYVTGCFNELNGQLGIQGIWIFYTEP